MAQGTRFLELPDDPPAAVTPLRPDLGLSVPDPRSQHNAVEKAGIVLGDLLLLSVKMISQRALLGLTALADLLLIGSAFVLWYRVMPEPSQTQLIGLSIYAGFILVSLFVRRRLLR